MKTCLLILVGGIVCLTAPILAAATPKDPAAEYARLRKLSDGLVLRGGEISLKGGVAKISVPGGLRYLDPKDSETLLWDIWGNPRGEEPLGTLVPAGFDPFSPGSWAAIISYSADGYVQDSDASKIDYDDLLKRMKEGTAELNKQREQRGYPAIQLVGWAAPPRYDAASHKLYWARELKFAGQDANTLNYNIRMLGRRGVLMINVVANMAQFAEVQAATPTILATVNFQEGHRYTDFNSSTDKMATYGVAALVAGGIAAKAGLFKVLLVGLLAAKKFIILAILAIAGFFKKLFKRKKSGVNDLATPPGPATSA